MPYPFNMPFVNVPYERPTADASEEREGRIKLKPGELSQEQLDELMRDSEVYTKPVG